jgi:hypothetical protein
MRTCCTSCEPLGKPNGWLAPAPRTKTVRLTIIARSVPPTDERRVADSFRYVSGQLVPFFIEKTLDLKRHLCSLRGVQ